MSGTRPWDADRDILTVNTPTRGSLAESSDGGKRIRSVAYDVSGKTWFNPMLAALTASPACPPKWTFVNRWG